MPTPSVLVATLENGVFNVAGTAVQQELAGQSVRSLAADGRGEVLAIVDSHSVFRRSSAGVWTELAKTEFDISCCVTLGDAVFVGTDDARILRLGRDGTQQVVTGFDTVAGRELWYAGTAVIDGRVVGPPLGIRSMAATCDGGALLANVHVGGIPRSTDSGLTWQPTIDVASDVHQVCAHPTRPGCVIAASAAGLCVSRDAGTTWAIEGHGLHALHCSAVAFGRDDMYVSASTSPFAEQGAVYRRPIDGHGPLQPLGGGMPAWLAGIADTGCIAARDAIVAVIDQSGRLYLSLDDGASWSRSFDERLAAPSALHIC